MRIEGYLPHIGRATKGGSLPYNNSNGNRAKTPRDFPDAPVHSVPGWKSALDNTCILIALPNWLQQMILLQAITRSSSPRQTHYTTHTHIYDRAKTRPRTFRT